jgi:ankyrin repeat protein
MSFVLNFDSFNLMNEDMQKAKSVITKNNIDPKDPDFLQIQVWLKKRPGFLGLFTKFRFDDKIPMIDLERLSDNLFELKDLLGQLPKPVIQYQNFEELEDDLRDLQSYRKAKLFFNALLPAQKNWYRDADTNTKSKVDNLALELNKLPKETQQAFIKKLARYKTLTELIESLEGFVNQEWDYDLIKNKILNTQGAELVYANPERELLIARIYTFTASKALLSDTSWCIKDSKTHWDTYVGAEYKFNAQYSIWDFAVPFSDIHTRVGVTIDQDGNVYKPSNNNNAAHFKDDTQIRDFDQYAKQYNIPLNVLKPMSISEKEDKQKEIELLYEFKAAIRTSDNEKIFYLFDNGLNPFTDDNAVMNLALVNCDEELFNKLINDYGYKIDGFIEVNSVNYEYIDYVAMQTQKNKDFIIFLYDKGCHIHTNYKFPLTLSIAMDDVDFYKYLLTKGYRSSDEVYALTDIKNIRPNKAISTQNQIVYASKVQAIKLFMFLSKQFPNLIKELSDEDKNNIASQLSIENRNKNITQDIQIPLINFYIENYKFDKETIKAFFPDVINLKNEELIDKFLAFDKSVLNMNISYNRFRETPMFITIQAIPVKLINNPDFSFNVELAKKLFDLGAEPCFDEENSDKKEIDELKFFYHLNDEKRFYEYLKRGGDINVDGGELLGMSVHEKDIDKIKFLLDKGANPNLPNSSNSIFLSTIPGRYDEETDLNNKILLMFLEAGAEPSGLKKTNYGEKVSPDNNYSIIQYASDKDVHEIMDFFYERNNDLSEICKDTLNKWVSYTIRNKKYDQLKKLIDKENLDLKKLGSAPITQAIKDQYSKENEEKIVDNTKLVAYLIKNGCPVNEPDKHSHAPIYEACKNDDLEMVKLLFNNGASLKDLDYFTIGYNGYTDILNFALENGYKKFKDNILSNSIFEYAASNGHLDILKLGQKYNILDKKDLNLYLLKASVNGHTDIVKFLESLGVDLNKYNSGSRSFESNNGTALISAIKGGNLELVKYLISKGAYYKDRKVIETKSYHFNKSEKSEIIISSFAEAVKKQSNENINDMMGIIKYFVEDLKFKYTFKQMLYSTYSYEIMKYLIENGPQLTDEEINKLVESYAYNGESDEGLEFLFNKYKGKIININDLGINAARKSWSGDQVASLEKTKYLIEQQGADPQYIYNELKTGKNLEDDVREYLKEAIKKAKVDLKQKERLNKKGAQ